MRRGAGEPPSPPLPAARGATAAGPRIGPNAITQVLAVLETAFDRAHADRIAEAAGIGRYRAALPEGMVPAAEARALHRTVRTALGPARGALVLHAAGEGTARYLLAHRIPFPAQRLLRALPAPLASQLLVAAIRHHAWTFGVPDGLAVARGNGLRLSIAANPLAGPGDAGRPCCDFHAATFEGLFRRLVDPRQRVVETACIASGDGACVFEVGR